MPKAITQLASQLTVGRFRGGLKEGGVMSTKAQVHDGDTLSVHTQANFGVRLLGVDAPEKSSPLPGATAFYSLANQAWTRFLKDPFSPEYPPFNLPAGLQAYLMTKVGPQAAASHYFHALAAEKELEKQILADQARLQQTGEQFEYFVAFAHEVMDRYGRLLGYINCFQQSSPRPADYNGRLLEAGVVSPYFIWPNVNPFRKQKSLVESVLEPSTAATIAQQEQTLRQARQWVQQARLQQKGLFSPINPLLLEAFELRYLAGRRPPTRWVIDLSRNDDRLIPPPEYYSVPLPEDRLFIGEEFVPLFQSRGWLKG